ncbi:MAG TPA: hypothetical protein VGJ63_05275 [Micromonosporaceae bacterium]|jgi:hypothetical protein
MDNKPLPPLERSGHTRWRATPVLVHRTTLLVLGPLGCGLVIMLAAVGPSLGLSRDVQRAMAVFGTIGGYWPIQRFLSARWLRRG